MLTRIRLGRKFCSDATQIATQIVQMTPSASNETLASVRHAQPII